MQKMPPDLVIFTSTVFGLLVLSVANPCEVGTTFAAPDSRIWGQHFGPTLAGTNAPLPVEAIHLITYHIWHQHSSQKDNRQCQLVSQCTSMASSRSSDDIRYCLIVVDSLL